MNKFIENDYTYYWGTSEFITGELEEIYTICDKYGYIPPIAEQCQYNMLTRKFLKLTMHLYLVNMA